MNVITNPYDSLYTNLKNRFTVVTDGRECSVGEYMRMKAGTEAKTTSLPNAALQAEQKALASFVNYVNDKLTVKVAPVKDRTIRSFPVRTSASAILSAVAACALVLSCGIFALTGGTNAIAGDVAEATEIVEEVENEATEELEAIEK